MPIKSYLARPHRGQKESLVKALARFPSCEITSSENEEVLIILTDTENEEADNILFTSIKEEPSLQLLTLVSAFSE